MLLFRVFNLNEDEGISRTELTTMLTHILHSTHTILHTMGEGEAALMSGEDTHETVKRMVDAAFTNCDISRTGKLLPLVSDCLANSVLVCIIIIFRGDINIIEGGSIGMRLISPP
jgi:hypothetical protein